MPDILKISQIIFILFVFFEGSVKLLKLSLHVCFLFGIICDTSDIYGLFSGYFMNMDFILEEEKTLTFYSEVQTEQNMQFEAIAVSYMAKKMKFWKLIKYL